MKENLFVLTGPTAIGKTELSVNLAKDLNGEVISCDSMQIYKYMDIGTAKVTREEAAGIKHHMVDLIDIDQEYTVADYKEDATGIITNLNKEGKLPIVTGGTGLYINSLVYELNFVRIAPNQEIRDKYEKIVDERGNDYLHKLLENVDFESAKKIHPNDVKRVVRALEIYDQTGKTMTEYNKDFRKKNTSYNLVMVGLDMDREKLYDRINHRVDLMIENGLIEEVKSILDMDYDRNSIALQGIGYKEIISYLEGEISLDKAIKDIKQGSRNYAKRQLTWFRRDKRIKWFNRDDYMDRPSDLLIDISEYVKSQID